jgi:hypothetical protein
MSARSMIRAQQREAKRTQRRGRKLAAGSATAALGAAMAFAPSADAANFEVLNTGDAGADTLRQAIIDANATAAPDTITFAPSATGEIALTSGELVIEAPVDIQGPGATTLAVDGTDNSRIFSLDAGVVGDPRDIVSISGLTLRDGNGGDGGAIYSYQTDMRLASVVLYSNYASGNGGAIDVEQSPITIVDSTITGNESTDGGAMYTDGDNGATNSQDTITIDNSVFTDNYSTGNGGVGYFDNATGGDIVITDTEMSDNEAIGDGGGLFFYGHKGSQTVRNSTISGNIAGSDGGGIFLNTDYDDPFGMLVENSTVSSNDAGEEGGGIYIDNSLEKPVRIENSTVVDNVSGLDGGGIHRDDFEVELSSTIVANNDSAGGPKDDLGEGGVATDQFSVEFSLVGAGFAGVTVTETTPGSNITGTDPQLGPLAANGGPTDTHLPAATSPVVDAGTANGLSLDQRGLERTVDQPSVTDVDDGTDIGSVERAAPVIPPDDTVVDSPALDAKEVQKQKGKKIKVKVTVGAAEAVDVVTAGKIKAGKKKYNLKSVTTSVGANGTEKVTLKPKGKRATNKIVNFLATGKKAKAKVSALFTDAVGNEATEKVKVKLKAKK